MDGSGSERVKPLVSSVREYRWIGLAYLVAGAVLGSIAVLVGPLTGVLFSLAFFGVCFGAAMYFLVIRRNVASGIELLTAPPTTEREARHATVRRVGLDVALATGALLILIFLFGRAPFASGALLGMGGALLAMSYWLENWQREKSALVLREPRIRWRGGGIADRGDFYVVEVPSERIE